MKHKFCCEASRGTYEDYYQQQGRGNPYYQGSRGQRGHGIGSVLGSLFRSALPMIKSGLASFGKQALRTGMDIVGDMVDGQRFSEAADRRIRQGIKQLVRPEGETNQTGNGRRRKYRRQKKKKSVKRRRKTTDIFK